MLVYIETCTVGKTNPKSGRDPSSFLRGKLRNASGSSISFKMWNIPENSPPPLEAGKLYTVIVEKIETWKNSEYLVLANNAINIAMERLTDEQIASIASNPPFKSSAVDTLNSIMGYINQISTESIRKFVLYGLRAISLNWDDRWTADDFSGSEAKIKEDAFKAQILSLFGGRVIHHAYYGGWLIHTLEVIEAALNLHLVMFADGKGEKFDCTFHMEMIVAGGCLHDIGKAFENRSVQGIAAEETDLGRLHGGHMLLSLQVLERAYSASGSNMPRKVFQHIMHCVEAHHGAYSHVMPRTIPAICLQQADGATSRISKARDGLLRDPEGAGVWIKEYGGKANYYISRANRP